uniref:RING-type domain-containing protein n=1 Tax=Sphenodon punctatus TaxID=8508 RepID=A0A8D0GJY7_SPHPU
MEHLKAEITCSICLETLDDPVSIDCGHNFCHSCLSEHWSRVSSQHYWCPECRRPYNKYRVIPDIRLRNLVEKIGQLQLEKEAMSDQPGPGDPVQLTESNSDGDLVLNEGVLSRILESEEVRDAHVCLIAILGEQRRGKSFLLNYLLRRFQNMEAGDESWMGQEDEPLIGFRWEAGVQVTTLGVWMWNQPFWVQTAEGKVRESQDKDPGGDE